MKKNLPELLAPAGNMDSFLAAVNGGADAVYLGLKEFSARKRAQNFDFDELQEALNIAHKNNVKVYITLNTLIKENELESVIETLNKLNKTDVDGIIIQDLGLLNILLKSDFNKSVQMSTQASIYGNNGAQFFEKLGVDRVVYARETALKEIEKSQLNVEKKVFCHGALCFAYSGQCHLSSAIGGRSGNRGSCAQPCRRKYTLEKNGRVLKNNYLLSTKELNTLDQAEQYKNSNIDSLKIEGRLRSPEYVYSVTKAYRNVLDGESNSEDKKNIEATFNREYTEGLIFENKHNLAQDNPKNRGVLIGKVGKTFGKKTELILNPGVTLINGDGISFGDSENIGTYINQMFDSKSNKTKTGKNKILIPNNFTKEALYPGMKIFRSFDKKRIDTLKKEALKIPENQKVPVDFNLEFSVYNYPFITAKRLDNNRSIKFSGKEIIEPAQNRALTREEIVKQFSKLGGTDFILNSINIELDEDLFMSKKDLNSLRSKAVELLEEDIPKSIKSSEPILLPDKNTNAVVENKEISIRFDELPSVSIIPKLEVDEVVLTLKDFEKPEIPNLIEAIKKSGKRLLLSVPHVTEDQDLDSLFSEEGLKIILDNRIDGYLIPNFDFLNKLKEYVNPNAKYLEADETLNIYNSLSTELLKENGFSGFTVSDELSQNEIIELTKHSFLPSVLNIAGKRKLMVSKNCVFDCKVCQNCPNEGWYTLKNDFGDEFDLKIEDNKNHIYNAKTTVLEKAPEEQPYISKFRINITNENDEQILDLIDQIKNNPDKKNHNPGNYFSGVA